MHIVATRKIPACKRDYIGIYRMWERREGYGHKSNIYTGEIDVVMEG